MNQLKHFIVSDVDRVLIGHQLFQAGEMFHGCQLTDLFGQMPRQSMPSTANHGVGGSLVLTTGATPIASTFERDFAALAHDCDAAAALTFHRFSAATRLSQSCSELRYAHFQNHLTHPVFQTFGLLFHLNCFPRKALIEGCHFPTVYAYDNFYFHGVPSLGLRGSKPLLAETYVPIRVPLFFKVATPSNGRMHPDVGIIDRWNGRMRLGQWDGRL
jgi:hypothetical protein